MERASGIRLDPAAYPRHFAIPTRYADVDTQGHINNIAMAAILEDARSQYLLELGVTALHRGGAAETLGNGYLVTAAAHYEYLAQAFYPGTIEVHCGVLEVRRSSFVASQLAVQRGTPVAVAAVVFALTDGTRSITLPDAVREILSRTLLQPGPSSHKVTER